MHVFELWVLEDQEPVAYIALFLNLIWLQQGKYVIVVQDDAIALK